MTKQVQYGYPEKQGLYDPANEKENCGVGFVAHIKGERNHQIVLDAYDILLAMDHRGACGCESNTGDGAGIMTALPHEFLARVAKDELGVELPEAGKFGAGIVFLPTDEQERAKCKETIERIIQEQGQTLVGWRTVPVDPEGADIGPTALSAMPHIEQLIIAAGEGLEGDAFERKLYMIRKVASRDLRGDHSLQQRLLFYVCSLSTKVIIYKGMLTTSQLLPFFTDLSCEDYTTHLAMVHSRFSTNTFPSWDRAQPCRFMSHNGEINTMRGNINWMRAREGVVKSDLFGDELSELFPIMEPDCSDSGNFDNALEFLLMSGRTLQESVMMMIPEAWQKHETMSEARRAFYEYHSCLLEPWDGPASIVFTDGKYIGAVLDRNGLRPSRFYITHDDRVIMASEVGVLKVDPANVKSKGRLQPGRMFLVDFDEGRLVPNDELKDTFSGRQPYADWLKDHRVELSDIALDGDNKQFDQETLIKRMQAFGYTQETMQFMLIPMIHQQRDPIGSMGNDAAIACLSDKPRLIYDYFKQLFAQVTNPAIDSIREDIIMSLECYIGPEQNLLETTAEHANRLLIPHPILTNEEMAAIKSMDHKGWKSKIIDITYPRSEGTAGLTAALDRICTEAEQAIDDGYSIVVLSDRAISAQQVPISSLLACGSLHHHLVKQAKRTRIGVVLESGEAREVHHHCLLVGYGADGINPYLGFESLWQARRDGLIDEELYSSDEKLVAQYKKSVAKGILKVMGKMGISTLQSYKGAQIFEAVGLKDEVVDRCFVGTASRIQGVDFEVLATESLRRHALGYPEDTKDYLPVLPNPGEFHWRAEGERHAWDPQSIADIQMAARGNDEQAYWRFSNHINEDAKVRCTLRGLLKLKEGANGGPIPIEEVEEAKEIVKRFCTGAMSFGSISAESHETLAIAMNRLGGKSNTGEGGEDPVRFEPLENGDSKRSAIKQVASGRFGVTINYLTNADELQIKISQGAKPGEGGELPGRKVDENIARIRYSTPGVGLISPPPHHDIYSIEDLAQLIHDLKNANPSARISVKLVSEVGVGTIAAGVAKAHADHILISGDTGGTGASPLTSIKHAGLPWELGIAETHQTLVLNDLRSRTVLQTDGGLKTGRDVVIAALLGAEEMGFSTAPLITLGCIMMRKCHLNTCPVGIATQDPELREKFTGKPEHAVNYLFMVAEEARQLMAKLGFRTMNEMVGRVDCLETEEAIKHWKSDGLDLTSLLTPIELPHDDVGVYCSIAQDHGLELALDNQLLELAKPALADGTQVNIELPIVNTNRTVGTILSHNIAKKWGADCLPDGTVNIKFNGSAGQSVGAFLAKGVTIELEGDANDYVGKGLSGGRVIIYPPKVSSFTAEENIIVGNVVLYGATSGEAFFRGRAAERFCVRNSGAHAVIEGVGDHGCEYMTGGRVVILGETGRNFAAGMSGGVAYILDRDGDFNMNCNLGMVELEAVVEQEDIDELKGLIEKHQQYTDSAVAKDVLENWDATLPQFVKVMPTDYKRVLLERKQQQEQATSS
ncbi:MAG TPA: glutamate synthase large subunit [Planctomycetaceae bacterium]|jgi:glutamate synthase (NADPH/NADH) large chain|nr:glutamate synthase large subunit [Rhodopirellula sp.]MCH2362026.1 glutamate synthase large subunit [Pirellulales bacterium]HCK71762.1 glutamate synthase large subunit [Planctomycetaceae bacterium]HCP82906.1 glutamate synthase large subunit [Planctomycetaceae bacterium]|tara:strand:+ start:6166 stop:10737 length:4572 start_codon:yes stop_codon:yes gene_type:complete